MSPVRTTIRDSRRHPRGHRPARGRNRIAATFFDGPGWVRFRPWEQGFLILQGGIRRARMEILEHLHALERPSARGLEVGIGSGATSRFCQMTGPSTESTSPGRSSSCAAIVVPR